ncbi:DUF2141 domain-containing protein [Xylophilus ampelinus]|uniref:Uncharacterized protein (DUF2141 family) n=1 Tax=Xylophilus ampelinus TaxID=54067 RepID=A0A318SJ51_9BURK|nr:DUF2141 domain-containing protein [Xylophilus ampelinus]MCS4509618.1 DUF2141 domain-containing protein [Xylophilus ampelinus]PYE78898.1 uncharacterized protein (DUF2141 family) [Xylophilus ampelinus]
MSIACLPSRLGTLLLLAAAVSAHAVELTVTIEGEGLGKGAVQTALYCGAEGWLKDKPVRGETARAGADGRAVVVFRKLEPGRYGLSAFHDENADGTLDTYPLGIPREAYGFSRDARGMFGPPSFDASAIELQKDTAITVQVK